MLNSINRGAVLTLVFLCKDTPNKSMNRGFSLRKNITQSLSLGYKVYQDNSRVSCVIQDQALGVPELV
jgi:hypothetical protein